MVVLNHALWRWCILWFGSGLVADLLPILCQFITNRVSCSLLPVCDGLLLNWWSLENEARGSEKVVSGVCLARVVWETSDIWKKPAMQNHCERFLWVSPLTRIEKLVPVSEVQIYQAVTFVCLFVLKASLAWVKQIVICAFLDNRNKLFASWDLIPLIWLSLGTAEL